MDKKTLQDRRQQILDGACGLILRYGYDKTTVQEIAEAAGVSKGSIYLEFSGKKELFEALLVREIRRYLKRWVECVERDPVGGTLAGVYRNILVAQRESELVEAIYRQDATILGSYLRTEGNLFESLHASEYFYAAMQEAGMMRADLDAKVVAHVVDLIRYGLLTMGSIRDRSTFPPFEEVLELIVEIVDRTFAPEGGGDGEVGLVVVKRFFGKLMQALDELEEVKGLAQSSGLEDD